MINQMAKMNNTRNTIQRDAVYSLLKNDKSHPTAEALFLKAKQICPDISLATVYRHLKNFCAENKAIVVESEDKKVHYDGDVSPHSHFVCKKCGKIYDIFEVPAIPKECLQKNGFSVERESCTYFGFCPDCNNKTKIILSGENL